MQKIEKGWGGGGEGMFIKLAIREPCIYCIIFKACNIPLVLIYSYIS